MKRTGLFYWVLLASLLVLAVVVGWLALAPAKFELLVVNNSSTPVDRVSLSGNTVVACEPVAVEQLPAGGQQLLVCELQQWGQLRVNVVQGYNRIDHIVAYDMGEGGRRFTILEGNRFLLGEL